MAIYSLSVKSVSRKTGRSSVAASAYRAGPFAGAMVNVRDGATHDYSRRRGVEDAFVLTPDGCEWAQDRATLWNRAEAAEKRHDAKTAREYVLALPAELEADSCRDLVVQFGNELVRRYGVAVDIAIHSPSERGDQRNRHAHFLATTRSISADGLGPKTRMLDVPVQAGPEIEALRALWETQVNAALEHVGSSERVNHLSYRRRDSDMRPQWHLGVAATHMERNGKQTELGNHNRDVVSANQASAALHAELLAVEMEIARAEKQAASDRRMRHARDALGLGKPVVRPRFSTVIRKAWDDPSTDHLDNVELVHGGTEEEAEHSVMRVVGTLRKSGLKVRSRLEEGRFFFPISIDTLATMVADTPAEERAELLANVRAAGVHSRKVVERHVQETRKRDLAFQRDQAVKDAEKKVKQQAKADAHQASMAAAEAQLARQEMDRMNREVSQLLADALRAQAASAAVSDLVAETVRSTQNITKTPVRPEQVRQAFVPTQRIRPAEPARERQVEPRHQPGASQPPASRFPLPSPDYGLTPQDRQLQEIAVARALKASHPTPQSAPEKSPVKRDQADRQPVHRAAPASTSAPVPSPLKKAPSTFIKQVAGRPGSEPTKKEAKQPMAESLMRFRIEEASGLPKQSMAPDSTLELTHYIKNTSRLSDSSIEKLILSLSNASVKFSEGGNSAGEWRTISVSIADLARHLVKLGLEQVEQWLRLIVAAVEESQKAAGQRKEEATRRPVVRRPASRGWSRGDDGGIG